VAASLTRCLRKRGLLTVLFFLGFMDSPFCHFTMSSRASCTAFIFAHAKYKTLNSHPNPQTITTSTGAPAQPGQVSVDQTVITGCPVESSSSSPRGALKAEHVHTRTLCPFFPISVVDLVYLAYPCCPSLSASIKLLSCVPFDSEDLI